MDTHTEVQMVPLFGPEPDTWRARHAHLFRSDESLRFYLRRHRDRLLRDRAITMVAGRWFCVPGVMERVVFAIGNERAAA